MPTIFDPAVCSRIQARIDGLKAETAPAWGHFSAPEMVAHLTCALRAGLGELAVGPPAGPFRRFPLNLLIIHVLPWPKARAVSPREFLGAPSTTWPEDIAALHALVDRTAARGPGGTWPVSPVFGHISGRTWGVLHYKHLDHHLRQFHA